MHLVCIFPGHFDHQIAYIQKIRTTVLFQHVMVWSPDNPLFPFLLGFPNIYDFPFVEKERIKQGISCRNGIYAFVNRMFFRHFHMHRSFIKNFPKTVMKIPVEMLDIAITYHPGIGYVSLKAVHIMVISEIDEFTIFVPAVHMEQDIRIQFLRLVLVQDPLFFFRIRQKDIIAPFIKVLVDLTHMRDIIRLNNRTRRIRDYNNVGIEPLIFLQQTINAFIFPFIGFQYVKSDVDFFTGQRFPSHLLKHPCIYRRNVVVFMP